MPGRPGAPGLRRPSGPSGPGGFTAGAGYLRLQGRGGLKGAMERLGVPITELEVEDPGIYLDADTPQDYMSLRYWNDYSQIQKQSPKMIHFRISIGMTS